MQRLAAAVLWQYVASIRRRSKRRQNYDDNLTDAIGVEELLPQNPLTWIVRFLNQWSSASPFLKWERRSCSICVVSLGPRAGWIQTASGEKSKYAWQDSNLRPTV